MHNIKSFGRPVAAGLVACVSENLSGCSWKLQVVRIFSNQLALSLLIDIYFTGE